MHQALHEFILYAENEIPTLIHNVKILKEKIPADIENPIMAFLLNRSCSQVIEELIMRLCDGWKTLNKELRKLKIAPLSDKDEDYTDIDKMRDKLIAHRVEVGTSNKQSYTEWYFLNYGSFDAVFDLVQRIASKMLNKIYEIESFELLDSERVSMRMSYKFNEQDIHSLLNALKQADIY